MKPESKLFAWEDNGVFVDCCADKYVVFRPSKSGVYSETDSAYDRLDLAICRGLYLARGKGKWAQEAMDIAAKINTK